MKAIFLSDAHLVHASSPAYARIDSFIRSLTDEGQEKIDRLYILGDFFDFWFAKGNKIYGEYKRIIDSLVALRKSGVAIYFAEGNHEFFSREYLSPLGIETTEEHFDFVSDGLRFFVAHGDDFCGSSRIASLLKLFLKSEVTHTIKTVLPSQFTWRLSQMMTSASRRYTDISGKELARRMRYYAQAKLDYGYDVVIFGHSHFPLLSDKVIAGKRKVFVTLGDWLNGNGSYLWYNSGVFELKSFA
ncbi:MAG: UDP-2,3-diacylglucosamine diphosphatase [Deltaproteobacteria bacterium]|nr:UDP-2,3-diacylglucosamine diphosphatase [Deltaproteobacteria bacterium]